MAELSKLRLPNGNVYDFKVYVEHISGQLPITKGGTGASTVSEARENLELGTAALYDMASSVGNNGDLPTGAAIQTYMNNYIAFSSSQPASQPTNGIWVVTREAFPVEYSEESNTYGTTAIIG